ncbi:hypothetical protein HYG81_13680 [Natrinema zhouii]|uniref:PGF-CTERM sorting domain-containing protein n=1 Tax=Natrinema zhouii TaxID=1710539 RepID=A0A7D6CNJ5_9EURY|nr:hypothetical protein [Natrinema zhouii]QLK25136.1 hypothetical protein HYG81_13680 [Natrinema zhouii]
MRNHSLKDTAFLLALLLVAAIATAGVVSVAGAQTADYSTNETVTLTNETEPITVSVVWNETIDDPANTSATVTFYNETEYANDSANATIALEDTIGTDAGNTTELEYNQSDTGLDLDGEYRVVVTGPDSAIESASIEDNSSFLGGVFTGGGNLGDGGMLAGLAVIAVAVIGAAVVLMRD